MKRIFKNKFVACIIAAVIALLAAVFACLYLNKNDNTVTAEAAATVATKYICYDYDATTTTLTISGSDTLPDHYNYFFGNTKFNKSPWDSYKKDITTVVIDSPIAPEKMSCWFAEFSSLTEIKNLSNIDTTFLTDIGQMFSGCDSLTELDLSGWDVSKVTDILMTFYHCDNLESLNLSGWQLTKAESFRFTFGECYKLKTLNLSGFSASGIKNMEAMFFGCIMESVDLSGFDTSQVTTMSQLFFQNSNLKSVDISGWNLKEVTNFSSVFYECKKLTEIKLPDGFDLPKCSVLSTTFYECNSLKKLDVSNLSVPNVGSSFFYGLTSIEEIKISDAIASQINANPQNRCCLFVHFSKWYDMAGNEYTTAKPMTKGGTYYTEMPVCAHNNKTHNPAVAATCKSTGTVEYWHCNDCNKDIDASGAELSSTVAPIDPNNHKYTNYVYNGNATCINDGTKTASCDYGCGKTDVQTATGTATGIHTFTNYVSNGDATCMADGTKTATCDISGCTATETIPDTGSQLAHNYTGAAWSNNPSEHWHVCVNTGCTATDTHVAHSFQWIVDTPATVTTTGVKHEECTACGFAKSQGTVIPVATCPHSNITHNPAVAATCQSTGSVEYWHCNDCNKDIDATSTVLTNTSTAIDPNNHSFTNYVYNNDATCTLDGTETATCGYGCGAEDTRTKTGTMLNHDFTTAPWSTGTSNHWHVCTRTGCTATDTPAPHTFQWVVDTPATVTSTGVKHEACTVCGYTQSQGTVIPVLTCAHNNKTHNPAVAATCMSTGNVEYWYCSDCHKNVDAAGMELTTVVTPIDPNNHSFTTYTSNNDADCTTDGTKTAHCDYACGTDDTVTDAGSALGHTAGDGATCTTPQTCTVCSAELAPALGHDWATTWEKDTTNHWHICSRCTEKNDEAAHTYEWVITTPATTEADGLMENLCTECGHKDGEDVIAKLDDGNGNEIDLPVDISVEFKVTQSSTDNDYANIDHNLKRGYWAQLWNKNEDGTLGDEFEDKINCFITLKIPTEVIEAIRGGDEINRDKIAEGLSVYYINEEGAPVEVEKFTIAMRDDDSWQIKFNYNEKFRAEVVFAADIEVQPTAEPKAGIPWWVWLIVGLVAVAIVGVVIVIIVVVKKKNGGGDGGTTVIEGAQYDDAHIRAQLAAQDKKLDEIKEIVDGGFNDIVDGEDYK